MKKIFISFLTLTAACASAQVAIGKTTVSSPSVSLEFYDGSDNAKGFTLPWVTSANNVANAVDGTMIFDSNDRKTKLRDKGQWKDLTGTDSGIVDLTLQNGITEKAEAKVQIGGNPQTDTTSGILVLADTSKAMVLPKVANPHLTIINPEPGTMAYDTVKKQLAIYNGKDWSFWKP